MPTARTTTASAAPAKKSRSAAAGPAASPKGLKVLKPAPIPSPQAAKPPKGSKAAVAMARPKPAAPEKYAKAAKPPKKAPKVQARMVRDSFTMPGTDFALVAALKARARAGQRETKKSELLRAGLHALTALDGPALLAALGELEPVKIGRPKKGHGQA
jgi:hypothetical protein